MEVSELIYTAQRLSGVLQYAGRTASTYEQADALAALNAMLDAWNTERLTVYTIERQVFTLTPSLSPHTIGASGTFNVARPVRIENAGLIVGDQETPLEMLDKDRYARVLSKALTSTDPCALYDDRAFPVANLYFWPVPTTANQVALYTWNALAQFAALDDEVAFPPGYLEAIEYNLAVRLAAMHPGAVVSPLVIDTARTSLARIKRLNMPEMRMDNDAALLGGRGYWDIRTGDYYSR